MTDEYMDEQWSKIEARMKRFEETASPQDKLFLDCMVRDWEAKMRLKLKMENQKLKGTKGTGLDFTYRRETTT